MTKSFTDIAKELGELVTKKNAAYGYATKTGAEAMRVLFPNGVKPEQYEDFGYCLLVWHKLSRIATNPGAFGENPKQDIAGYSLLALSRDQKEKEQHGNQPISKWPGFLCPYCQEPARMANGKYMCWPCWHKNNNDLATEEMANWRDSANEREIAEVEALLSSKPLGLSEQLKNWPTISEVVNPSRASCRGCVGLDTKHTCIYGSPA